MRTVIQWLLWGIGLGLQFLVVSTLLAGPMREYTAVFIYAVLLFFTTMVEMLPILDQGRFTAVAANIYWICEFVRQASLVFVVLSFVARSVPDPSKREPVRRLLVVVALLFWATSFYIHYSDRIEFWMTNALRNVSFGAAIVNLGLWFVLVASKRRDSTLLMITGGLGLQMTGEAIGQSLRQLSRETVLLGNLTSVLAHFLCLYIWWQAFRPKVRRVSSQPRQEEQIPESAPVGRAECQSLELGRA